MLGSEILTIFLGNGENNSFREETVEVGNQQGLESPGGLLLAG